VLTTIELGAARGGTSGQLMLWQEQPRPGAAPFIKWVGGKARLLPQLLPLLPPDAHERRHVEPFLGGGALLLARRPADALVGDVNARLCATYEAVRLDVDRVIAELRVHACAHSPEHYQRVRTRFNEHWSVASPAARAAMFIYLNKTCFNGLYRVNRRGDFNVPVGRYATPAILNEGSLRAVSSQIARVQVRCASFEVLLSEARADDFVYLDPPYVPVSNTANFAGYSAEGFGREQQLRLRDAFGQLHRRGCMLMLSNSDVVAVRELYADFRQDLVSARRSINSKATGRGAVSELVIRNY
jgi:DNA adenine methylase